MEEHSDSVRALAIAEVRGLRKQEEGGTVAEVTEGVEDGPRHNLPMDLIPSSSLLPGAGSDMDTVLMSGSFDGTVCVWMYSQAFYEDELERGILLQKAEELKVFSLLRAFPLFFLLTLIPFN
tara:strand:- start:334 stop:699 length:366 start_codon:yes stop_codon:yes gene_type:complete